MGKYAPNKKCTSCIAIGELCMGCAIDWKTKHIDKELRLLRRLERAVASRDVDRKNEFPFWLERLAAHRKVKPRPKASLATSPETIAAIVAMREAGAKQVEIARELGVSQAHVSKVLARDVYRHATVTLGGREIGDVTNAEMRRAAR